MILAEIHKEMFGEGICLSCHGDDVECEFNCTKHVCVDCDQVQEHIWECEE